MLGQITLSAIIVAAALVTMNRAVPMPKLLGCAAVFDIVFSVLLFEAFGGSFAGLIVSAMAGLIMAVCLTLMRGCLGYQRPCLFKKRRGLIRWNIRWVTVAPKWTARRLTGFWAATPA